MTANEYLRQMRTIGYQIRAKKRELENLKSDALFLSSPVLSERVQGGEMHTENKDIENILELEQMIARNISNKISLQVDVHKKLDTIKDGRYNAILTDYYINGLTHEQIAHDIGYGTQTVSNLKGEALTAFRNSFGDNF